MSSIQLYLLFSPRLRVSAVDSVLPSPCLRVSVVNLGRFFVLGLLGDVLQDVQEHLVGRDALGLGLEIQ